MGLVRAGGQSLAGVARDLGINENLLRKWKHAEETHGEQAFPGQGHSHHEELAQLQREVALLRQERDILKKAIGYCASAPR